MKDKKENTDKKTSKHGLARQRILDVALETASRDGLQTITFGKLAQDMAISKSGLFGHFGSKEKLQLAVIDKSVDVFTRKVITPAIGLTGEARLRSYCRSWLDWANWEILPGGCPILIGSIEFEGSDCSVNAKLKSIQTLWVRQLIGALKEGQNKSFHADINCETAAFEIFSLYLGHHYYKRVLGNDKARKMTECALATLIKRLKVSHQSIS